jgi:predicted nucleotidyltransferase
MIAGFTNEQQTMLSDILDKFNEIEQVVIYGSRAKGNFKIGSDVDLTLKGGKVNHQTLQKLASAIHDSSLPYQFDISLFQSIENNALIEHINRVGIVVYDRLKSFKNEFEEG